MSIPTGGAGGFAKAAGSGAAKAGSAKSGADAAKSGADAAKTGSEAAKTAKDSAAPAAQNAVNATGKGAGNDMAKKAGFGSGGGVGGKTPGASAAGIAQDAVTKGPSGAAANVAKNAAKDVVKMGAGGTSPARRPGDDKDSESPKSEGGSGGSGVGKAAAGVAAVPMAGAAGQLMFAMMILNWLKSMFFAAMAMAANFINMLIGGLLMVGKAIVGGAMAAGAAVSSFVGGAISAATGAVATVATTVMVVGVGAVSIVSSTGNDTAQRDGGLFDCGQDVIAAMESNDPGPVGDASANTEANARLVFGVLAAWGMADENIAGILGNWDAESGIDPTGVETVFGEPFALGPNKQAAEDAGFDVDVVDPEYGAQYPGVQLLGIGLGQWSNGRNTQLLDYAENAGDSSWATLETQLGFMISEDSGAPVIEQMIDEAIGSPEEAAVYFHDEWERSADTSMAARESAAAQWFSQMGSWEANQSLADSILAQTGTTIDEANENRVSAAQASCQTSDETLTSGLAEGGMSLEEAEALMETYISEGDAVLAEAFGAGGPGDCGFGKADNCVGFSSYFVWKFTSFKQYAPGNGIDTAESLAGLTDRETSTTPSVYSVFSTASGSPEGHTGVVLGIEGDTAIIGEASCGSNHAGTRAFTMPISEMDGYVFTDVSDLLTDESMS